jgi:hypothetical protein
MDAWHVGLILWGGWSTCMWWHWQKRTEHYQKLLHATIIHNRINSNEVK